MSYDKIEAALETQLLSIVGVPTIYFENGEEEPTVGSPYVEAIFVPTIRTPSTRGRDFQTYYQGVFRLICAVPAGVGRGAATTLVQKVLTAFEANTDITYDGLTITTRYADKETGSKDGPFYKVPVNIGWYVYTNT